MGMQSTCTVNFENCSQCSSVRFIARCSENKRYRIGPEYIRQFYKAARL